MARNLSRRTFADRFAVSTVPVLNDNYSYIIRCFNTGALAAVDVSQHEPVISELAEQLSQHTALASAPLAGNHFTVLTTHRHLDHCGGNKKLAEAFGATGLTIHGGELDPIPNVTHSHKDGDTFPLGQLVVNVHHTPCHTKGHVVYHVFHPDKPESGAVFTGDTMFVGGLGAFFEGNAEQMVAALKKIGTLPPPTRVFPGHEYTLNFLKYAKTVEPTNRVLAEWTSFFEAEREKGEPAVASTLEAERQGLNPFLRAAFADADLVAATKISDPVKLMQHLYDECP